MFANSMKRPRKILLVIIGSIALGALLFTIPFTERLPELRLAEIGEIPEKIDLPVQARAFWSEGTIDPASFAKALGRVPVADLHIRSNDIDAVMDSIQKHIPSNMRQDFPFPLVSSNIYRANGMITLDVSKATLKSVLDELCRQANASWEITSGKRIFLMIRHSENKPDTNYGSSWQ